MNGRRSEFQTIDVSAWPTVEADRHDFEARRQAVVRFAAGESVATIEQATGVNRRQLPTAASKGQCCLEKTQKPVFDSDHVDYLYFRLFALITLLIRKNAPPYQAPR
jgi:hypothetical protein